MTRKMKDSGVEWIGEIPEDWEVRKLGNISNLYTGDSIKDNEKDNYINPINAIPYIATKDVGFDNKIHYDNGMYIKKEDEKFKRAYRGNTLICIEGGSAGRKIAKVEEEEVCFGNKLCCINSNAVNNKYIYYYSLSPNFINGFQSRITGLIPGVTLLEMAQIEIVVPSEHEQKSIVDFLDEKTQEIDNIISKTKKAIEEYKRYKQSLITETVTKGLDENVQMKDSGIEWIGEIPENWDIVKFKRLFRILNGKEIKNELNRNSENAIKVYGSGGVFKYTDDFLHNKTSILFGRKGTIGKPVIAEGKFWTVDTMYYTDIIHGDLKYIYYILKAFPWEIITTQTALPSITSTDLLNKYMSVAPLKEQEQIASYLDEKTNQIDQIISTKEKLLIEMEAYKKSLIYETVTGKREVE